MIKFLLKRNDIAGVAPALDELMLGELALNTYDGKLYTKINQNGLEAIIGVTGGSDALSGLSDVIIDETQLNDNDFLKWDSAAGGGLGAWVATPPQTIAIDDLSDVDTTTVAPQIDDVLSFDGNNWVPTVISGGGASTGLESITEGGNTGWRLIGRDPNNYGDIGEQAVDFSYSNQPPNSLNSSAAYGTGAHGAIGKYSVAFGYNTTTSGEYSLATGYNTKATSYYTYAKGYYSEANGKHSHAEGYYSLANGEYSHASGYRAEASGKHSHAEGYYVTAPNDYMYVFGKYNVGTLPDTIHETGIGYEVSGQITRKNAFEIYTDGRVTAPELTTILIDNDATGRILTTKEWVQNNAGGGASQLELIADQTTGNVGWRLLNEDPTAHLPIGEHAVDLTYGQSGLDGLSTSDNTASEMADEPTVGEGPGPATALGGAQGNYSFAAGYASQAVGDYSFAAGAEARAFGIGAAATGISTTAYGHSSTAAGWQTAAVSSHSFAAGSTTYAANGDKLTVTNVDTNTNTITVDRASTNLSTSTPIIVTDSNYRADRTYLVTISNISGNTFQVDSTDVHYFQNGYIVFTNNEQYPKIAIGTKNIPKSLAALEVGIYKDGLDRYNGLEVYHDGSVVAPELTPALVDNNQQTLVPLSYLFSAEFGNALPTVAGVEGTLYKDSNGFVKVSAGK